MSRKKDNKKKWNKNRLVILCVSLVLVGCGVWQLTSIVAKYYATRFDKGIAIASNLYFNSDKLMKASGITDIDSIYGDKESINKINVFTNNDTWASGTLSLNFNIRNYDNNILYNDSDLDIGYTVKFVLLDEPMGASYHVDYTFSGSTSTTTLDLTKQGEVKEVEGMIRGGSMATDVYYVKVNLTATKREDYKPARVLVLAYPTSPDYVKREENQEHEYRLLGIFQGQLTDGELRIESDDFKIQSDNDYESNWYNKISDLSGYIFNIKTAGDMVMDNSDSTQQFAHITWDSQYLVMDFLDDYYQEALEHDKQEDLTEEEKRIKVDGTKITMDIEVLPYTSIDFTFYRTAEFAAKLDTYKSNVSDGQDWFEKLVEAKIDEENSTESDVQN